MRDDVNTQQPTPSNFARLMARMSLTPYAWLTGLQPGSPVAVLKVVTIGYEETYAKGFEDGYIRCSDGLLYDVHGRCDKTLTDTRVLIQPSRETTRDFAARTTRQQLRDFPWRELGAEQLDAVLKYAQSKRAA